MVTKEKIIFAALIGASVGDFIPTIGDAIYFTQQQKLKEKLNLGLISPEQYWKREALYYYTTNSLYWLIIALILYKIKGDYHTKIKVGLWILGGSAVFGVIHKNISKDKIKINADCNGSGNIIRKEFPNAFADGIQGVVVRPLKVNISNNMRIHKKVI